MTIYHKHHYIPKHAGGSNDSSNLIMVTIQEHALFHYERWVLCGDKKDHIAWLALSGGITKEDAIKHAQKIGREKADKKIIEKYGSKTEFNRCFVAPKGVAGFVNKFNNDPDFKTKHLDNLRIARDKASDKNIQIKKKETFKNIKHQQGPKNSQYGSFWITDGSSNRKIRGDIPEGWRKGRKNKILTEG